MDMFAVPGLLLLGAFAALVTGLGRVPHEVRPAQIWKRLARRTPMSSLAGPRSDGDPAGH